LLHSNIASAQDDPSPPAVHPTQQPDELTQVQSTVREIASQERTSRYWVAGLAIAMGAVAIPAGFYMLSKDDSDARTKPGSIVATGGIAVAAIGILDLLMVHSGPTQNLAESLEEDEASGRPRAELLARAEKDWAHAAERRRSQRKLGGGLLAGLGAVSVLAGATVAFIPWSSSERREAMGYSGYFFGLGLLALPLGVDTFIREDPIEAAWRSYQATRSSTPPTIRLALSPAANAVGPTLTGRF